jgi:hypothetical protein
VSSIYSDIDKLVLERWEDVKNLAQAQKDVQSRIEEVIEIAGERIGRWLREQGYEFEYDAAEGSISAWRPGWAERRKAAKVVLALGGLGPLGYNKSDEPRPFLWVYTEGLASYRVKDAGRLAFAADLRRELGSAAAEWDDDGVDDTEAPLGQYLKGLGVRDQCRLVASPENLVEFAQEQFPRLFRLADAIDACLVRMQD